MSLVAFQELFANLVADPVLCKTIIGNPEILEKDYQLSTREIKRINSFFKQKGMGVNCMLYQINRFTPLYDLMPYTCKVLHKTVKSYTRVFWDGYLKTNFQFRDEVLLFGEFMQNKIQKEGSELVYLLDIVNFEITYNRIRFALYETPKNNIPIFTTVLNYDTRLVFMQHDIRYLIDKVIENAPSTVFENIPKVDSWYLIKFNVRIDMQAVSNEIAHRIQQNSIDLSLISEDILKGGFFA